MRPVRPAAGLSRRGLLGLGAAVPVLAPILATAGCGSPDPGYYALTPWPGPARPGGPLTVEVRSPGVAAFLDRDHIVRNDTGYRLKLDQRAAWASPLPDMIGRTLALDLAQRLPGSTVIAQGDGISTEPLALVELDLSRFLEDPAGRAEILGTFSVHRPGSGVFPGQAVHLTRQPDGSDVASLVAALSALLGQLADRAADALRALPPPAAGDGAAPAPLG